MRSPVLRLIVIIAAIFSVSRTGKAGPIRPDAVNEEWKNFINSLELIPGFEEGGSVSRHGEGQSYYQPVLFLNFPWIQMEQGACEFSVVDKKDSIIFSIRFIGTGALESLSIPKNGALFRFVYDDQNRIEKISGNLPPLNNPFTPLSFQRLYNIFCLAPTHCHHLKIILRSPRDLVKIPIMPTFKAATGYFPGFLILSCQYN